MEKKSEGKGVKRKRDMPLIHVSRFTAQSKMKLDTFPIVILIGRPAAGKSEVIDYLKQLLMTSGV
jgi:predicted ATPase